MIGDIVKESLAYQIYDDLRHDILTHKIGFGAKLTNRELQERYNVSSTPVRDAINRLYLDGFVTEISRAGAKVVDFDVRFAVEVNAVSSMLSQYAVKCAAQRGSKAELADILQKQIDLERKYINSDKYYKYDIEFHSSFFRFADNQRLLALYQRYADLQEMLSRYIYDTVGSSKLPAIDQHQAICDAYRAGDVLVAQQLMEQHYFAAESAVRQGFAGGKG